MEAWLRTLLGRISDGTLLPALGDPGDPKHAEAVAAAKERAAARIDAVVTLQNQVYAVLTPEQKARLPGILADMQARIAQRRAAS